MKVKNLLLLASIIVLNSCSSSSKFSEHAIIGSWQVSKETGILENAETSKGLKLYFYPDSSYTLIGHNDVKLGKWNFLNEKEVKYGNNVLTIENFDESELNKSLIVSIVNEDNNTKSELVLEETLNGIDDYKQDPFHQNNNKWRLRPNRKETDTELRARLSNYILHNAYILKSAYEKNSISVSFKNSNGPIKIYKGAIGSVTKDKISEKWLACFYDKDDAVKAFNMYNSYLGNNGVSKGETTGDWVLDDYKVLISLYSKVVQGPTGTSIVYTSIED
jgi:hypothetical protein